MIEELIAQCSWDKASWLIFSDNVFSPLIYYSHLLPLVCSLVIGIFVLIHNPRALTNRILFALTVFFSLWVYSDLVLWASEKADYIMFFWSILLPVEFLVYAATLYLVAVFANRGRDVSMVSKLVMLALMIPILFFSHTSWNLLGFDYTDCDREAIEGPLWQYLYLIELFIIGWAIHLWVKTLPLLKSARERFQLSIISLGCVVFLTLFSVGNILITYFLDLDWRFEQYKLFGMPIFVAFVAYSIVRFKTFNSKALASEALITGLAFAVISLLFVRDIALVQIIVVCTFFLVCVLGYILIRNVRNEIEQREHIEILAKELQVANDRLKELDRLKSEFLSIASHDLRTPITAIRNFVSLLREGMFGKVPAAAEDGLRQVFERATDMTKLVENYLNVSRIEQGKMKYDFVDANFTQMVQDAVSFYKAGAEKKGLVLTLNILPGAEGMVAKLDTSKINEVINNLIDNSIKYTMKGSISLELQRAGQKARLTLKDTGVGMSAKTMAGLFKLFSPGEDSKKINPNSTGVGLYITKAHVEAHKGTLVATSPGEGKGSQFVLELPLAN